MKRLITVFILFFAFVCNNFGSYVENMPYQLTQPNGEIINCFITGDEYYRRVFDENGFTIIRNPNTGYIVYAELENDSLIATNYIVGQINPALVGLTPNLDISIAKKTALREAFWQDVPVLPKPKSGGLRTGTLNNITIYIKFADGSFNYPKADIENLFTNPARGQSLMSYYRDVSNNTFNIISTFFPETEGTTILCYTDTHERNYYQPYDETTNPNGYHDSNDRRLREHELLHEAIVLLHGDIEAHFSAADLDYDNDGRVDNISFIVQGGAGAWSSLLWPHRWALYNYQPAYGNALYLNGKMVWDYFFVLENHLFEAGNGLQSVLCHELGHVLSAPDLYRGYVTDITPVGSWDLMASNTVPPQSQGAYVLSKYHKFIGELPEITSSGTYTVYHTMDRTQGHNVGYKIISPNSTIGEYYVIDYRKKTGINADYEVNIPGQGITISRINPTESNGNIYGGGYEYPVGSGNFHKDEIYIYRPNADNNTTAGTLSNAFFSNQTGRTAFNDTTNPPCFLTDNSLDDINISQISAAGGDSMTFYINMGLPGCAGVENFVPTVVGNHLYVSWVYTNVPNFSKIYLNGNLIEENLIATTTSYDFGNYLPSGVYNISIHAVYDEPCGEVISNFNGMLVGPTCNTIAIETFDSFGDGWQGASIDVIQNNFVIANIALENGYDDNFTIPVYSGMINFVWHKGSWDSEVSIIIKNYNNDVIYSNIYPALDTIAEGTNLFLYNNACIFCDVIPEIIICEGTTLDLTTAINYVEYPTNNFNISLYSDEEGENELQNNIIIPAQDTIYYVQVTANESSSVIKPINITVLPIPIIDIPDIIICGQNTTLPAPENYSNFTWYDNSYATISEPWEIY
ncbi:MAG: hypothetical protein LBV69_10795 [Bacteroidales bacterium]|jgi:M6 family metalloprotease-like protein|nr:hypothetical protein [Bacteroidales bacterium]